jgi:hypothetical protein
MPEHLNQGLNAKKNLLVEIDAFAGNALSGEEIRGTNCLGTKGLWQHRQTLLVVVPPARIELAAHGLGILKSGQIRTDKDK